MSFTTRPGSVSAPARAAAWLCFAALALVSLALGACGGGGGGGTPEPEAPEIEPSGLRGTVQLQALELGRIAEQEPNDSGAQPCWLAPVFPRCAFEIVGHSAAIAADLGQVDVQDVFRFVSMADQDVALDLTYRVVGVTSVSIDVAIHDAETGTLIASTSGGSQPLTTGFTATAGQAYDLRVQIASGSAAYMLRAALTDPAGAPKPSTALSRSAKPPLPARPAAMVVAAGDPACACDRVLVQMVDGADPSALCQAHGLHVVRRLASGTWCLGYTTATTSAGRHHAVSLAGTLADCAGVRSVEPDWIVSPLSVPSDAKYGAQWNLRAIGCESAWDITTGDSSVVIGVIDGGILPNHPDLVGQTEPGYDFISDAAVAGDGDGRDTDPTDVGDRFLPSGLSTWHGSHVSGICVGAANAGGVTGVAPGCRVMPLRTLGIGGGFVSDVSDAVLFGAGLAAVPGRGALAEPLPIINMSIGLNIDSSELRQACDRAFNRGVFLVAAAGNTGQAVLFPARYSTVFAVGAVDTDLTSTSYSNFGTEVELAAPGGLIQNDGWGRGWPDHIVSCVRDETVWPHVDHIAGLQGTSQAAPHVAAAAALMLSIDPTLTSTNLRTILTGTALDVGAEGQDVAHGWGLVQIHSAVKRVLSDMGTPRADAPILELPTRSLRFTGFDTLRTLPISNGGGGSLVVTAAPTSTDDGGLWLSASLEAAPGGADTNVDALRVTVDRTGLSAGRYSGTIRLANPSGVLTALRIVMYISEIPRMGRPLHVVAIEEATMIARRTTAVYPEYNWRYWLTGLPESFYKIEAGEDLDEDTFFCELADHCAWWGGPTEATATAVRPFDDEPAIQGLHILLLPPGG